MATKPLAAKSSPGLEKDVRCDHAGWNRLDRTSILQEPIPKYRIPRMNPLGRLNKCDL